MFWSLVSIHSVSVNLKTAWWLFLKLPFGDYYFSCILCEVRILYSLISSLITVNHCIPRCFVRLSRHTPIVTVCHMTETQCLSLYVQYLSHTSPPPPNVPISEKWQNYPDPHNIRSHLDSLFIFTFRTNKQITKSSFKNSSTTCLISSIYV